MGPLTWVKGEIDQALDKAGEALRQCAGNADPTQLKFCRTHMHQVHGALSIVGLDGVTQVTDSLEALLLAIEEGKAAASPEAFGAVEQAIAALRQYLDDLMAGEPNQPLRLLPAYQALAQARGVKSARATDLFYPDLSVRPPKRTGAAKKSPQEIQTLVKAERARFQKGLLMWLKKPEAASAGLEQMRTALANIEASQETPAARAFWWVSLGFLNTLSERGDATDVEMRQLCARIDLQIRRLLEGSRNVAERLMRDALYYIAQAPDSAEGEVHAIRNTFQLDSLVPAADAPVAAPQEALLRRLRETAASTEELWNKFCAGSSGMLGNFAEHARNCLSLTAEIGHTDLKRLGQGIGAMAKWLTEDPARHSESVAMEVATAILLLQNAQENFRRLGTDFAQQVDLMVARLHACIAGKPLESDEAIPLLDEMTRRAQEKLLIGQVAREIQNNLAQIEQALDAFFRDPEKAQDLAQLEGPLKQVAGALTILGHDSAITVLEQCRRQIRDFAQPGYTPAQDDFEKVAQELSMLGFFVDSLQHGTADFDTFVRQLNGEPEAVVEEDEEETPDLEPARSVETELEQQKRETQALVEALKEKPEDAQLKDELKQNLQALQKDADLVADQQLADTAKAALSALAADDIEAPAALDAALSSLKPAVAEAPAPSAQTLQLAQSSGDEIDAELLDIFLEEAQEVLGTMAENLELLRADGHNTEALTTVRRNTHTLKGSGRMVGLNDLGETAWALEQTLNLWLRQELEVTPELLSMIEQEQAVFSAWVRHLEDHDNPLPDATGLVALAERLRGAEPLAAPAPAPAAPAPEPIPQPTAQIIELPFAKATQPAPAEIIEFPEPAIESIEEVEAIESTEVLAPADEFGSFDFNLDDLSPPVVEAPPEAVEPLPEVPATEPEVFQLDELPEFGEEIPAEAPPVAEPVEAIEPISGLESLDMPEAVEAEPLAELDFPELGESTEAIELIEAPADLELPEALEVVAGEAEPAVIADLDLSFSELTESPTPLAPAEAVEPLPPVMDEALELTNLPELGEAEVAIEEPAAEPVEEPAEEILETLPEETAEAPAPTPAPAASPTLYDIFREEARGHMNTLANSFGDLEIQPTAPTTFEMTRAAHTLGGIAATVGLIPINKVAIALEHALLRRDHCPRPDSIEGLETVRQAIIGLEDMFAALAEQRSPEPQPALVEALEEIYLIPTPAPVEEAPVSEPAEASSVAEDEAGEELTLPPPVPDLPVLKDELDEQLLPIFLEEAQDIVRGFSEQLRAWRAAPEDSAPPRALARLLHTFKGSARMAGAMNLGEATHILEARVEDILRSGSANRAQVEEIENGCDTLIQLTERLQDGGASVEEAAPVTSFAATEAEPEAGPAVEPVTAAPVSAPATPSPAAVAVAVAEAEPEGGAQKATLRVRADLLDRLVNEAGELSIARARIEGEMRGLKGSLLELTENVIRLRRQLREIEIQAETQMQANVAQTAADKGFDPLELDRFTRFQELTRFMAESVNDVATLQQNLLKNLDDANAAILAQARLNRSLQQQLMGVRMVPFDSQSERLYRIVRQTAKEVGKRANLDIRGGQVEIDRSVLDKMLAPLEHMLRNAITHGIEDRDERVAKGKSEIGEVTVSLQQEGNEIILSMADDGSGLDPDRIRARAEAMGLLAPGEEADDTRIFDFIFQPGFSTAAQVTQVAGRGVGMDVVRTEVASLGGRIEILSTPGKGTTFRLYLPLTLAVTQTLLVRVGTNLYAIPSTMIEQVQELKEKVLHVYQEKGEIEWMGHRYPIHFLPKLLGDTGALPETRRLYWILLLRSGSQRVAVQVDELQGNQEVVVKNIGPQLARVVGIAGATVLGDGQVVLILNPVALASRTTQVSVTRAAPIQTAQVPAAPAATLPTVMVVDDSLTVRKITGRLLSREGYQVVTAKDGVDALEQLTEIRPDVILSDVEMPRMDGFDLLRNIRADDRLKSLPVIMITSRTADKHRNYAIELGANDYLGKPYDEDTLLRLIDGFVKAKRST
ncbi:MAG TPA: Hpt domain-containing protein [Rhodocyclaceae bacterium]|nr:Hpt domain-containing protein [Rhodocyclaceae bacterium]